MTFLAICNHNVNVNQLNSHEVLFICLKLQLQNTYFHCKVAYNSKTTRPIVTYLVPSERVLNIATYLMKTVTWACTLEKSFFHCLFGKFGTESSKYISSSMNISCENTCMPMIACNSNSAMYLLRSYAILDKNIE